MPLLALLLALAACSTPRCGLEGRPAHHGVGGFCNEPGAPEPEAGPLRRAIDGFRLATERERGPVPAGLHLSPAEAEPALLAESRGERITWLGHSTVLFDFDGPRVLTDPVWSRYVTPVPPIGPKRVAPPPVRIEALPPIDVVLISHSHYDHLDLLALRRFPRKDGTEIVVPLGLGPLLRSAGFSRVTEIDWWQEVVVAGMRITALPAAHASARRPFRKNDTLWASYAMERADGEGSRIYWSGDSGFHTHFERIGRAYGPFDLAVMNLGGYGPREIAQARHITPSQMVAAVDLLRARRSVPIHWGTYPLGTEPTFAPGPRFLEQAREAGWERGRAILMRVGETRAIGPGGEGGTLAVAR